MATKRKVSKALAQIGETIRAARSKKGWTATDVALRAGYASSSSVTVIENGTGIPSDDGLRNIFKALGLTVTDREWSLMDTARKELYGRAKPRENGASRAGAGDVVVTAICTITRAQDGSLSMFSIDKELEGPDEVIARALVERE